MEAGSKKGQNTSGVKMLFFLRQKSSRPKWQVTMEMGEDEPSKKKNEQKKKGGEL